MHQFSYCIVLFAAGVFGGVAGQNGPALAEDFRVDNATYASGQKEPSSQSITIFRDGVVYDFMKAPDETVVFEKNAGRFILLNLSQRLRAELPIGTVASIVDGSQPLAAKSDKPLVKFLAEPKFQEQYDEAAGELTLSSQMLSYRLLLLREVSPSMVEQYHEFCDWYARLNALLTPGSGPPFGRLVVNAAIAKRQAVASQVSLTVSIGKGAQKPQQQSALRSEHRVTSPLGPADLDLVAQARKSMSRFKLVSFEEYRKAAAP